MQVPAKRSLQAYGGGREKKARAAYGEEAHAAYEEEALLGAGEEAHAVYGRRRRKLSHWCRYNTVGALLGSGWGRGVAVAVAAALLGSRRRRSSGDEGVRRRRGGAARGGEEETRAMSKWIEEEDVCSVKYCGDL